jgi:hypothetical protein
MKVLDARASSSPPLRTEAQRLAALQRGNEIRVYRATLKRDIKAGLRDVLELLAAPRVDDRLATMKVFDLLVAMPKTGRVKANVALKKCAISPSKTLGGLSQRQRSELVRLLADRRARPTLWDAIA